MASNGINLNRTMQLSENRDTLTATFHLTAGQTDLFGRMPVTLIASRAIDLATEAANLLGIGYSTLANHGMTWVLARMTIEMIRYPKINEYYTMSTWIEGYNRFFSDRCFVMTDADGNPLAHIRSVWVAIDIKKRTMADLSAIESTLFPIATRECPVAKCRTPLIARDAPTRGEQYTFRFCDLDFNGHVNTLRYLDLVLNQHTPDWYRDHTLWRLEASFDHECHYDETVDVVTGPGARDARSAVTEIRRDGRMAVSVALTPF